MRNWLWRVWAHAVPVSGTGHDVIPGSPILVLNAGGQLLYGDVGSRVIEADTQTLYPVRKVGVEGGGNNAE